MNKKNTKLQDEKGIQADKPRRGRPRKTEVEKAADPRKILVSEIKADLKKVKKSKKRLSLLLEKAQAEQGTLMAALLDSLEKIKAELKKKPKKAKVAKKAKRGRPGRKPGRKPGGKPGKANKKPGKPGRKPGRPKVAKEAVTPVKTGKKRGRPKKVVMAKPEPKRPEPARSFEIKEVLVTPIPKPGMIVFKKAVSKPAHKKEIKKSVPKAEVELSETPDTILDEKPKVE